jgi:hypothetical protein
MIRASKAYGLGDKFDTLHTQGLALDETQMITLEFAKLAEITQT